MKIEITKEHLAGIAPVPLSELDSGDVFYYKSLDLIAAIASFTTKGLLADCYKFEPAGMEYLPVRTLVIPLHDLKLVAGPQTYRLEDIQRKDFEDMNQDELDAFDAGFRTGEASWSDVVDKLMVEIEQLKAAPATRPEGEGE